MHALSVIVPGCDGNNNEGEVVTACPVLLTNILATHTETFRSAQIL